MGCSPSKTTAATASSLTPTKKTPNSYHHQPHLIPSSYGLLNLADLDLPPTHPLPESLPPAPPPHPPSPMHDVLSTLHTLDSKSDSGPQSWLEVSNMLQTLKPGLHRPGKSPSHPDSIDINDIMRDLDDDSSPNTVKQYPRKRNAQPFDKSMPIHTLEELDGRQSKDNQELRKGLLAKANIKRAADSRSGFNKPSLDNNVSVVEPSSNRDERKIIPETSNAKTSLTSTSLLFDSDFLGSYKQTLGDLSEDDWKAVDASEPEGVHKPVKIRQGLAEQLDAKKGLDKPNGAEGDKSPIPSTKAASDATVKASTTKIGSSLEDFESICPPAGGDGIVLYTTSLKKIKKTYEDCIKVKDMLLSYATEMDERDVSLHLEYRNELWELMQKVVTVPRLFIRGRYIGGAKEIVELYEQGKLANLLQGLPQH